MRGKSILGWGQAGGLQVAAGAGRQRSILVVAATSSPPGTDLD